MPIIDSKTGKIKRDYTVEELVEKAKEMRAYNMIAITADGSGYTGGTLSIMDIARDALSMTSLNAQIYFIGDCVKPRKLYEAIHEGTSVAWEI